MKTTLKMTLLLVFSTVSFLATAKDSIVNIQTFKTKNGVPVYLVERKDLPMLDLALIFDAGSRRDEQHPGRAALTGKMLSVGSTTLSADDIANRFEDVGAQFNALVGRDVSAFTLRTLTEPTALKQATEVFQSVLTEPAFPEKQFQRLQKQALMSLQLRKQSASTYAADLFYKNCYPAGPYSTPVVGTEESVGKMTLADIKNFYQKNYVTGSAKLVLVGNVNLAQAKKLSDHLTSAIPHKPSPKWHKPKLVATQAQQIHQPFPGPQTAIILGQLGIQRDDPRYYTLEVGNSVLGGMPFYSRLFLEVRKKQGLSYSVGSDFSPMKQTGPFTVTLQTQNEKADLAIKATQDTVRKFISEGPSEEELSIAKKNIQGQFPLSFASNEDILSQLLSLAVYDLPLDYFDQYRAHIDKVTQAEVQQAFKELLSDQWLLVRVGAA